VAGIKASERAGGIQPDQPIRLRTALRSIRQGLHGLTGAEISPRFEDRVIRHRLHPQPFDRLGDLADFHDVAENKLTLPAGVAGVDDVADVLALGELEDLLEAGLGVWDGIEIELVRDGGQDSEVPWQFLTVRPHRHPQLDEVADGRGDDGGFVLEENVAARAVFVELAEHLGEDLAQVRHDARFFGNDECFSHGRKGR
jgi:hypothetical protein